MSNQDKILEKANELGHLLKQNDVVKRFGDLAAQLDNNEESRKLLDEYVSLAQKLQQKEQMGQPIEPEEKKEATALEEKVRADSLLAEFMATQVYYVQLMERVNQALANPQGEPPKDSGIVTPGKDSRIIVP